MADQAMANSNDPGPAPIAVVGLGAIYPGRGGKVGFWQDILSGADNIRDVPPTHWLIEDYHDPDPSAPDKTYAKRGGFLSPTAFDPLEFGIPPNDLKATDTAQLLALVVARQVLREACATRFREIDKRRASVILGVASTTELVVQLGSRLQRPVWVKALREEGLPESQVQAICNRIADSYVPWQECSFPGLLGNVVAGRIANRLDLGGSNYVTDAACASSLSALQAGLNELYLGQSDLVITGGVDALNDILMYLCFSKTPAFSPTGDCRPFSDRADGTMIGEGLGMLALRRLADAERDGNAIYAVVRGLGASSDGRSMSVYAPRSEGQAAALTRAYDVAGYAPATVELVEAHGTATVAGDIAEFRALKSVFAGAGGTQWCALGSIKSQIGHTKAASGAAGLIKAVLALHHKVLPPTIKVERPNPALDFADSPFYLNTAARPWIRAHDHPRRASVSSFGFGGSNFHATLEEYTGEGRVAPRIRTMSCELFLLSSATSRGLADACTALGEAAAGEEFVSAAQRSQAEFDARALQRLAVVARTPGELAGKLALVRGRLADAAGVPGAAPASQVHHAAGRTSPGKVAFLFPGQGSQYVGMGSDLAMSFDLARGVWDLAAGSLSHPGKPLHRIVFPPPAFDDAQRSAQTAELMRTANAQPAIAAASLSQLALLQRIGLKPDAAAGHSFGEVVALHAAGAFDVASTLAIARQRGVLMAQAAEGTEGAMLAVRSDHRTVSAWLAARGIELVIANDNAPNQVVLSGPADLIGTVADLLAQDGLGARRLAVASAFHSPLVAGSCRRFGEFLDGIRFAPLELDVFANTTAAPYPRRSAAARRLLAGQLAAPVRFRETVESLYERDVRVFVEVGPGSVLSTLVDGCLGERPHAAIALDRNGSDGIASLWDALGQLSVLGVVLDFAPLWEELPARDSEKASPPAHAVQILGSNYGKPYPPAEGVAGLPGPNPEAAVEAAASTTTGVDHDRWLAALDGFARETSEAQRHFEMTMAQSHQAYLETVDRVIGAIAGGFQSPDATQAELDVADRAMRNDAAPASFATAGAMGGELMAAPPQEPYRKEQPVPEPEPVPVPMTTDGPGLATILMTVVAEKTGYPPAMLSLDMELEAGLGIDSIKQVEILSELRERRPDLPEIAPELLAELKTLGQIIDYLGVRAGDRRENPPLVQGAPPDAAAALLEVVAEKTGYPLTMLTLDMELEAGLGIDSIKQVEILSGLRERRPDLPEIDPGMLAELKTLSQIVEFIRRGTVCATEPDAADVSVQAPSSDATDVSVQDHAPVATMERLVPFAVAMPAPGFALAGIAAAGRIAVVPDDRGIGAALIAELESRGISAGLWDAADPAPGVIHLGALSRSGEIATADFYWEAVAIAKALLDHHGENEPCYVTVQDTGGSFGFDGIVGARARFGGMPALVKTILAECPAASGKAIDIALGRQSPETVARRIADELFRGGPGIEIGLGRGGARSCIALRHPAPRAAGPSRPALADGDFVVVSGGARGVTTEILQRFVRHRKPRLLLIGSTVLEAEPDCCRNAGDDAAVKQALLTAAGSRGESPNPRHLGRAAARVLACREIRATLAALRAAGVEVEYRTADIANAGAVAKAIAQLRRAWGPVAGVIHAAGVVADKPIVHKTRSSFERVYETKVDGLDALLRATREDPLRLVCVFSSIAARNGNAGQCDYAIANEVLNKIARAEASSRNGTCLVRSINWGPWDGGMVDASLKRHFERLGVGLITPDMGAGFFREELSASPADVVEVVAAAGIPAHPARCWRTTVVVDGRSFPYLGNHRVNGEPVLPMVLVIEWFMRVGRSLMPDLVPCSLNDIRVLRGVVLDAYPGPQCFEISAVPTRTDGTAKIALELRCSAGALRYSAVLDMVPVAVERGAVATLPGDGESSPWPYLQSEIYAGKLFHGADFQVIRKLESWSATSGSGVLDGTLAKRWPGGPWSTDPAALDGGLQLGQLWGMAQADRLFLPLHVGAFIMHVGGALDGPLRCVLNARMSGNAHIRNDLTFTTLDGRLVAELQQVEMYGVEKTARADAG
jgi:acyl transferase domain-containing protein/acyl carrier protein/NADP-dependent 3-hydroxy acid dehydrogenase YdfG